MVHDCIIQSKEFEQFNSKSNQNTSTWIGKQRLRMTALLTFAAGALLLGWTTPADAANGSEAYHSVLPRRMRNPNKAIRRQVRGIDGGRRTLHRIIQSPTSTTTTSLPDADASPGARMGSPGIKEKPAYTAQFENSPSIRGRALLPFIDGSASDDLLVSDVAADEPTTTTSATMSLSLDEAMSQPLILQSMSLIYADMSMKINDSTTTTSSELDAMSQPLILQSMSLIYADMSMKINDLTTSFALDAMSQPLILQSMSLIYADMSMRINDESSNDTNFPTGPSIELLESMSMQEPSTIIENSGFDFELSMPTAESFSFSYNQKLTILEMSMRINDDSSNDTNFPNGPIDYPDSMSMQDFSGISMTMEFNGIALDLSMPVGLISLSYNQELVGLSMAMRVDDALSFSYGPSLFDPLGLNDMSMSMPKQVNSSDMSIPLEFSEISLSMDMIDTSNFELSMMSLELNEMSMPMMFSARMNDFTSDSTFHIKEPIVSNEMSLSMMTVGIMSSSTSSTHNLELSMPLKLYELELGDLSMPMDILDTVLPSKSPARSLDLSMSLELNELSMSLDLSDFSMSLNINENSRPSNAPTLVVELIYTELSDLSEDLSMSMDIVDPSMQEQPTSSDVKTEGSTLPPVSISVQAEARLDLIGMHSTMDGETTTIFENSCGSFFGDMLAGAKPLIYDVQCDVTDQMLLSERRLRKRYTRGTHRNLENESSLLVDLIVTGRADSDPNDYGTKAYDAVFADLVNEISSVHSMGFVVQLKEDGYEAGIDDFEKLTSINYIDDDDESTRNDSHYDRASESDIGSDGSDMKAKVIAISSMAVCGVLILGMILLNYVGKRKRASSSSKDESVIGDQLDDSIEQLSPKPGSLYQDLTPRNFQEATPKNEQLTYMYSLDDGLATPSSIASHAAGSPSSAADRMQKPLAQWSGDEEQVPTNRIQVDIVAPPGKLGIIIDTCSEGPIVHSVKPTSPLDGLIFKGDLVVAVDGEDTREWSAHYLTKLMVSTLNPGRYLVYNPLHTSFANAQHYQSNRPR
jgi:hypothetical protein